MDIRRAGWRLPRGAGFTAAAQRLTDPAPGPAHLSRVRTHRVFLSLSASTQLINPVGSPHRTPHGGFPSGSPYREATMTRKITLVAGVLALVWGLSACGSSATDTA